MAFLSIVPPLRPFKSAHVYTVKKRKGLRETRKPLILLVGTRRFELRTP